MEDIQHFPQSTFTTADNITYSFIYIAAASRSKTLLFLHGFPSTAFDWVYQIRYFSALGYGVLAPDLLGYGRSSKPVDAGRYRLMAMSKDLEALMVHHLGLRQVIGVGHDFGATLLSRFVAYCPSRVEALVFLAVGPPKLGTPFDVDMINRMTKEVLGFELLGYIPWLADHRDASETLKKHARSVMSLIFCENHKTWDTWFHPLGQLKRFAEEDRLVPIGSWYPEELQRHHLEAFEHGEGYRGAVRWYQMWKENLFAPDEKDLGDDIKISQPTLLMIPKEPQMMAAQQDAMLGEWIPNFQVVHVDSGHWVQLERSSETNLHIAELLESLSCWSRCDAA